MPLGTYCLVSRRTRPCRRASCGSAGPGSIRPGWPPRGRTRCTGTCRRARLHVSTSRTRKPHALEYLHGVCVLQCAPLVPAGARAPLSTFRVHRQLITQDAHPGCLHVSTTRNRKPHALEYLHGVCVLQCAPLVPAGARAPLSTFRVHRQLITQDAHPGCPFRMPIWPLSSCNAPHRYLPHAATGGRTPRAGAGATRTGPTCRPRRAPPRSPGRCASPPQSTPPAPAIGRHAGQQLHRNRGAAALQAQQSVPRWRHTIRT